MCIYDSFFFIAMTVLQSSFLHDTHLYVFLSVLESLQYDCYYLIICILHASSIYVNVYKNPMLLSISVEHLKHSTCIKTAGMLILKASEVNYDL